MNKKGIELAANTIIVIIIGVVLFGLGLKLAYDAFFEANAITKQTQQDIDKRIQEISCTAEERVCIGSNSQKINRNEAAYFTIVIYNDGYGGGNDFTIDVTGTQPPTILNTNIISTIPSNEYQGRVIGIFAPKNTARGTYSYDVKVTRAGVQYDTTKKLFVTVV